MKQLALWVLGFLLLAYPASAEPKTETSKSPLIGILGDELQYAQEHLAMPDGTKPYYLGYTVTEVQTARMNAELGALNSDDTHHYRVLDVDVRVGEYKLDNTHKIRGGFGFDFMDMLMGGAKEISLDNDPIAIKQTVWLATDGAFKSAVKKYQQVQTNLKTMVEEEDQSDDFTREQPSYYFEPEQALNVNRRMWADRIRRVSAIARQHPEIYNSSVSLSAEVNNRYMVTSEGTQLQTGQKLLRVSLYASTKADDGMNINQHHAFDAVDEAGLPSEEELSKKFQEVIDQVVALRRAPLVEPYTGPAILVNRASAVFFHEIFGHRIEGHRQRDVEEGQTFTKKVGEEILPTFLSVHDDPTKSKWGDQDLRGYYKFDDEGVPAQDVTLVDQGVLKNFLMSRTPVEGFPKSNGHGRREPGNSCVSRMANTIIYSSKTCSFDELRQKLIEECKKQDKPYGLLFDDISGGFTRTRRSGAQAFKVLPIVVYKVYPDGRPDELVRGVDIVGTPLTSFSKIIWTGDDPAVFNGTCGAESGGVPVSGVSPSILVSEIEIEKRRREQEKPPILTPPIADQELPALRQ